MTLLTPLPSVRVMQLAGLAQIGPGAGAFEWVNHRTLLVTIEA